MKILLENLELKKQLELYGKASYYRSYEAVDMINILFISKAIKVFYIII
jgi:hypothetical protein